MRHKDAGGVLNVPPKLVTRNRHVTHGSFTSDSVLVVNRRFRTVVRAVIVTLAQG
jgi:hypothetical protein